MTGCKSIERAFGHAGETADAAVLPQRSELISSAGQEFMGIGLMTHVPDNFILWGGSMPGGRRFSKRPQRFSGESLLPVRAALNGQAASNPPVCLCVPVMTMKNLL